MIKFEKFDIHGTGTEISLPRSECVTMIQDGDGNNR